MRNQGLAWSACVSALQSIILPYFIKREQDGDNFWILTFITTVSFISGFLLTLLPETLNEKLPQTIFDAEVFGLNRKVSERISMGQFKSSSTKKIVNQMVIIVFFLQSSGHWQRRKAKLKKMTVRKAEI